MQLIQSGGEQTITPPQIIYPGFDSVIAEDFGVAQYEYYAKKYIISSGVTSSGVVISAGEAMFIYDAGTANDTLISGYLDTRAPGGHYMANHGSCYQYISSGGSANDTTIKEGGNQIIENGGVANGTIINGRSERWTEIIPADIPMWNEFYAELCGNQTISSGGIANDTVISNLGIQYISSGGIANNTTVHSGGTMHIFFDAYHSGTLNIGSGAVVSAYGGELDFTVAGREVTDEVLISNYNLIGGRGNLDYSITVDAEQATGTYKLASGASNYNYNATVKYTDGTVLGTIAVDGALIGYGVSYTLSINSSGILQLSVSDVDIASDAVMLYSSGVLISSGTNMRDVCLNSGMSQIISCNGIAFRAVANSGGSQVISSGGTANSTIVNSDGLQAIYFGGIANSTSIGSGGSQIISSGGTANSTIINSKGLQTIYFGGIANSTVINSGGELVVSSMGTASSTVVSVGGKQIISGGTANATVVSSGGNQIVYFGGVANSAVISQGGSQTISSGGTANSTVVSSGGNQIISSGGMATNIEVRQGARLTLTVASDTYIQGTSNGFAFEIKDAYTSGFTVNAGWNLIIASGGTAINTTINGGYQYISGGTASNTTIVGGYQHILFGGIVQTATINNGEQIISCGGVANRTTVINGIQTISSGGTAFGTNLSSNGQQHILQGGTAYGASINSGGNQTIFSGGMARDAHIISGGIQTISFGGLADYALISNGSQYISSGGTANATKIMSGHQYILFGGAANDTSIMSGHQYILAGGTANGTVVSGLEIWDAMTSLEYYGCQIISAGGTATNTMVLSRGVVSISSGGCHSGTLNIGDGGFVSAYSGAKLDFTVAGREVADDALVTNYYQISGGGNLSYSITVDAKQATGTYKLASGASNYNYSATVKYTDGTVLGTLAVDGALTGYGVSYALSVNSSGVLLLSVTDVEIAADAVKLYSSGTVIGSGASMSDVNLNSRMSQTISCNGIAFRAIANSGGSQIISSGGTANSTIINSGGLQTIYFGGIANSTSIGSGGRQTISLGGMAKSTVINSGGEQIVSSMGIASTTVIRSEGEQILSGGTANSAVVSSGGNQIVYLGGVANSAVISQGGGQTVSSGGTANSTIINSGGLQTVYFGGIANSTSIGSGGRQTVSLGGMANSAVINLGGEQIVSSMGIASATVIRSGGEQILSGGTANGTVISASGNQTVYLGGMANSTVISQGGSQTISSGGVANATIVSSGGEQIISSGGTATNIEARQEARLTLTVASNTYAQGTSNGFAFEIKDAYISGFTINSGWNLVIASGGTASNTTINGGNQYISGGMVNGTIISSGGYQVIYSGGIGNGTFISGGGGQIIYSGGIANNTGIGGGSQYTGGHYMLIAGRQSISGGTANSAVIYSMGEQTVWEGVANDTIVSASGLQSIAFGGIANRTIINVDGSQFISFEGVANSTVVSGYLDLYGYSHGSCYQYILSGGTANVTAIKEGGNQIIESGGVANSTTISGRSEMVDMPMIGGSKVELCGSQTISSGGKANNTTVLSGGVVSILSGGCHSGTLNIGGGVSAYSGAMLDFTIAGRRGAGDALVTNYNQISGKGNLSYSITVDAKQTAGTYKLASWASNYNYSTTVKYTDGTVLGTLSVGGFLANGDYIYGLVLNSGNLNLIVESTAMNNEFDSNTNLLSNGYSQIVAWDSAGGKVGYVATDGQSAPTWAGIWEWGSSEATMWKVVGVGRFSADVEHDGILLYNGIGNTFAAWTDLNDPSYGYISLCHVDGNFQTLALADFDGNGLDDVIIYDENGSFGIVSDAAAYHDVWHVDNPETNVQQVIGAGYFGNADGKSDILVKKTDENAYFLWHNEDPTFETWNWSLTHIGSLDDDWVVAAIGDFQGDGVDDIIMWQQSTGFMYAWEDGKASNQRWVGKLDPSDWEVAAVGDYNGDGKEDLLLRELNSGWGGVGYWAGGSADNWTDLNARIETDMESKFAVIA